MSRIMDLTEGYPITSQNKHCILCSVYMNKKHLHLHHVSYFPENVVYTCKDCHGEIHRAFKRHKHLAPKKGDAEKFYGIAWNNNSLFMKRKKMNIVNDLSV